MLKIAKQHNLLEGELAKRALSLSELVGVLPYSLEMVEILADLDVDRETILAAILYPVVKTTDFDLVDCAEQYGEGPAKLVEHAVQMDGVRDLYAAVAHHGHQHHKVDVIRKMLLAMITDTRAVLIKLAEQVYLMRSAKKLSDDVRLELAKETAAIYAPLANRLGIGAIKWELEDWSFRYLDGEKYRELSSAINQRRVDRECYIKDMVAHLEELIAGLRINKCKVYGRPKHIYSIYRKMQRKNVSFAEIYDSLALRVLVPTINDCYKVLSAVHSAWQYIPQEFDDYIATPKANGYRSIHTAIFGPDSRAVEIQIRTFQMHDEAELGAAAHWVYKEGGQQDSLLENKVAWLRQVAAWQQEVAGSDEVVEDVGKVFDERVYVFTPQNEVIDLPYGATPLDFAYHIHTSIGNRYRGAKVNGVITALGHVLKNGDKVEILTKKEERPSRDWLNEENGFVRTSRARAKIHHWFRQQEQQHAEVLAKSVTDKEFGINRTYAKNIFLKLFSDNFHFSA
ncbi:MAG: bifunctional (p)ppGpp synthetase/guanosine-3',5'-bis(diphosphate) 3'-pyrophosphohydrolase [Gammaproteobacteria bacterium]|nr:bifunctional (p)ppGpp synthetase/guanosine-3',5'-bis(diphosphate) 3'-pyrophosphohydrolase [Gammaproteobacteria bacterium]